MDELITMKSCRTLLLVLTTALLVPLPGPALGAPGDITLVSVRWPGQVTSMYASYGARISADGRFLAFLSTSPDLVPRTPDLTIQIYVRNLQTGTIERASADSAGHPANADSDASDLSADGRFVAFATAATNVVAGDTNTVGDVFVRDRLNHTTERVSVTSSGAQGSQASYSPSISADGRFVAFASRAANLAPGDSNKSDDVFVHDRQTGRTERISVTSAGAQANGTSFGPAISADGRFVAFISRATNLVAGDTNAADDVFIHDRTTGQTERLSLGVGGAQANGSSAQPLISADGRYVAFGSDATNLVTSDTNGATDLFVRDRQTGATERVSVASGGAQTSGITVSYYYGYQTAISADGRFVSFASGSANLPGGGTNTEIYVHDRLTGQTLLGSASSTGLPADNYTIGSSLSGDGRYLGFASFSSTLVKGDRNGTLDAFVRDRQASTVMVASTNQVKSKAAGSYDNLCDRNAIVNGPAISADGRYVAFMSTAPDVLQVQPMPDGLPHVFVRDRLTGKSRVLGAWRDAMNVAISTDGSTVAGFGWCASGAFIVDRQTGTTELLPSEVNMLSLSQNGRYVAFDSFETNLVPGDSNAATDIFVLDRVTARYDRVSVSSGGQQAESESGQASISGDGRYVLFTSGASNLVAGDTNGEWDTFVHDRTTGKTERVSVNSAGRQTSGGYSVSDSSGSAVSADGRYVAFSSTAANLAPGDTNNAPDVFVRDRQAGKTERVSVDSRGNAGNGNSALVAMSPDGRLVLFWSEATNLAPGSPFSHYFVHDRVTGTTEGLLADQTHNFASTLAHPAMSADARFVAFSSYEALVKTDLNTAATNFGAVDTYLLERAVPAALVPRQ